MQAINDTGALTAGGVSPVVECQSACRLIELLVVIAIIAIARIAVSLLVGR